MNFFSNNRRLIITLIIFLFSGFATNVIAQQLQTHSGPISSDETWLSSEIHRVSGSVTVAGGVTLTIEPGAIVKFDSNTSLQINGVLVAEGDNSNNIIFTSYRDDSVGGDTNGDGDSVGQPGDWYYLGFSNSTTSSLVVMDHVEIRYSGSNYYGSLYINQADIAVTNSAILDSGGRGITITNASPYLGNNRIERSASAGIYVDGGGSSPTIHSNGIRNNNASGVHSRYANVTLTDNTIEGNGNWGFYAFDTNGTNVLTG
ncbi:MAG: parallel beta-helix repeat protein, partial [Cellvibrionaceae bacterium]